MWSIKQHSLVDLEGRGEWFSVKKVEERQQSLVIKSYFLFCAYLIVMANQKSDEHIRIAAYILPFKIRYTFVCSFCASSKLARECLNEFLLFTKMEDI